MLWLAVVFLIVAIAAYFLGAGQAGDMALMIAKVCFVVFLVLFIITILFGGFAATSWPFYGPPRTVVVP